MATVLSRLPRPGCARSSETANHSGLTAREDRGWLVWLLRLQHLLLLLQRGLGYRARCSIYVGLSIGPERTVKDKVLPRFSPFHCRPRFREPNKAEMMRSSVRVTMRALIFGLIVASVSVSESRAHWCRTFNGPPWDAAPIHVHPSERTQETADSPLRDGTPVVQRWEPVRDLSGRIWVRIAFPTYAGLRGDGWMRDDDLCPAYDCGHSYGYRRRYRY
jgi:hypothetical protein